MGRVSTRYNYRISKTKKVEDKKSSKKLLPVEKIVIRNKKKVEIPKVQVKKSKLIKKKKSQKNPIVKVLKNRSPVNGTVTLKNLKDY